MKSDTVAVHGGYETDPTTRAVAVPIYQTVAYEFESADHGAALFNLEVEGHRYQPHQQSDGCRAGAARGRA
jgi:O-acetylhomoserine (thiol)-lyase